MILCFHEKLDEEVLARAPFDLIRGPLGAQNAFHWAICSIFWMHKRAARVDLGPHGSAASQPLLRVCSVFVRKMSVLRF